MILLRIMKNSDRGFIIPLIIILIVLAAGGAYAYTKVQSKKVTVTTTTTANTTDSAPVTLKPPVVSSTNPTTGQSGTVVTVSGTGFDDKSQVRFEATGGNVGTWDIQPQSVSSSSITFAVPAGAPSGSYIVLVANTDGDWSSANASHTLFRVTGTTNKTTTVSTASSDSVGFNAKVVGGTLSKTDRDAIIAGTMKFIAAMNSGDPAAFRKYAAVVLPVSQLESLNNMSDQQLLQVMTALGKTATEDISPASMSSPRATWLIVDGNNVQIKIQVDAHVSETIQGVKVNGVWY